MTGLSQCWGLLPLLALVALYRWRVAVGRRGPEALLQAAVLYAAGVWGLANGLSAFGWLQSAPMRLAWLLIGVVSLASLWRWRHCRAVWPKPANRTEWLLLLSGAALLGLTLLRAVVAPPNTVDVLNYHMPRQLMWLQQGGLDPFLTVNDRQNMMPPLAEVLGMQFLAITGDDYWTNLTQWAAYAGLGLAMVVLARRVGATRTAAGMAALLGLLLPMAYHEASNAKNDLLSAFWLLCAAVQLAHWRRSGENVGRETSLLLAIAVALAWLTKSTVMLFAPPLVLAGLWSWLRHASWPVWRKTLVPAVLLGLLLIAPFHGRNYAWYGTPLGEHRAEEGGGQLMEAFGARPVLSNMLRHATLHLLTGSDVLNSTWLRVVQSVHQAVAADVDDRHTTLWTMTFTPEYAPAKESTAGAPAHFILGLPMLLLMAGGVGFRGDRARANWLAGAVVAGAVLFCLCLKWQPWAARLQLPLFALGTVAVVAGLDLWLMRFRWIFGLSGLGVAVLAWVPGADTVGRTLWTSPTLWAMPREVNYYRMLTRFALRERPLVDVIKRSGARNLLIDSVHDVPYPLMRKLKRQVPEIRFAGAPPMRLRTEPPEGLLILSLGAPMPLYTQLGARADWRLVGQGFGEGFYLPVDRVLTLGWWNELPDFAGWSRSMDLPTADWSLPDRGLRVVHEMPREHATLVYMAAGRPLRLRATLQGTGHGSPPRHLTFSSRGETFETVPLSEAGIQSFEIDLPASPGRHFIELQRDNHGPAGFVFIQLQINDQPSPE